MRFVVYIVAVLAAAGIVYFVGTSAQQPIAASATAKVPTEGMAAEGAELQVIGLKVPGMHCPMACYPSVKKTLEGESGVHEVDLVEQKQEGMIDNPVVIIKHDSSFDMSRAVASLEKRGFADATVTEETHD